MKRFFIALVCAAVLICQLAGCSAQVDLSKYISEKRSEIYLYSDDDAEIKLYCVSREQPYAADGICGDVCDLIEIYVTFAKTPAAVEISVDGLHADMNYEAVDKRFTLSYSAPPLQRDGVDITLNCDGEQKIYRALNVKDKGVLSCEQAVKCAYAYDKELFDSLKTRRDFAGEIYVRLLYDDGCYYYVGLCDRNKNITAYLLDGGIGKVISTKKLSA